MPECLYEAYDSAGRRKYLTAREGLDFLEAARSQSFLRQLFCELVYYSGCRISEAIGLTREDIDSGEAVIRIRCLKKRGKILTRRVPLPAHLIDRLLRLPQTESGPIWQFSRMTGWRVIKAVMAAAAIDGIHASPKGLRHGFGVRAALANIPVNVIQRWMGHAHPLTTAIYLAVRDDEERSLMSRTWN